MSGEKRCFSQRIIPQPIVAAAGFLVNQHILLLAVLHLETCAVVRVFPEVPMVGHHFTLSPSRLQSEGRKHQIPSSYKHDVASS